MEEEVAKEESRPRVSKVILLPGNGCDDVRDANWYHWAEVELQKRFQQEGDTTMKTMMKKVEVVLRDMPDPYVARRDVWLPFIRDELGCDENTVLIGHSSGAQAIMRLLEQQRVRGAILVSACYTDLGNENERASGYYADPWPWAKIRGNADWIVQFGSADDPFIPQEEMELVHRELNTEYICYKNRGHFMTSRFPELVDLVMSKIAKELSTPSQSGSSSTSSSPLSQ